jgi:ABC-2 type transport system ATP-binding protein
MLFLDEPTAGVDPVSRREFWEMIYTLAGQGVSVLATTHYMDEAEFCNLIGMMYQARMIALADPDTLKNTIQGVLFEINSPQPDQTETILKHLPFVQDVAMHGVLLRALVENENDKKRIQGALQDHRVASQIERVLPSLEDVFIFLVDQENRSQARADFLQGD